MESKLLQIPHHYDDFECMWNGIEDLYIRNTAEKLPPSFFFVLAGFGTFCYMKTEKDEIKRMVALGDARTGKMYEALSPIVGFDYKFIECKSFEKALQRAKKEIDEGYPVVLGALDMYHLSYLPKLYHGEHIPFHYILMVGYDDQAACINLYDCGREEMQSLPYEELERAWQCSYPGLSKPNTLCLIRMNGKKDKYHIAIEAFAKTREKYFDSPVGFVGHKGFEKFIRELPKWKTELSKEDYDKILTNMVRFYGTVPTIPNALRGIDKPDRTAFGGGFDKTATVLEALGNEYGDGAMLEAAEVFRGGAALINEIKEVIVAYLSGKKDDTAELPALYAKVRDVLDKGLEISARFGMTE